MSSSLSVRLGIPAASDQLVPNYVCKRSLNCFCFPLSRPYAIISRLWDGADCIGFDEPCTLPTAAFNSARFITRYNILKRCHIVNCPRTITSSSPRRRLFDQPARSWYDAGLIPVGPLHPHGVSLMVQSGHNLSMPYPSPEHGQAASSIGHRYIQTGLWQIVFGGSRETPDTDNEENFYVV
jgi:hypothetical protein